MIDYIFGAIIGFWLGWAMKEIHVYKREQAKKENASKAWCECGHETLQDPLSKIYEGGTFTKFVAVKKAKSKRVTPFNRKRI